MSAYAVNGKEPIAAWIPSLDTPGNGTTTLTDLVGSNNGTLTNMDPATDWVADTDAGGVRAIDFDGVNDCVESSQIGFGSSGQATLTAWVRLRTKPAFGAIFSEASGPSPSQNTVQIDYHAASDRMRFITFGGGLVSIAVANSFGSPPIDSWLLLTCVWTGTQNQISVNGGSFDAVAAVAPYLVSNAITSIGKQSFATRFFDGKIDDIRLFDQALDASDAAYLYDSGNGRGITTGGVSTAALLANLNNRRNVRHAL